MDDRTLLELAAKACGYTLVENCDMHGKYWPWCNELADNWSSLDVDGDALCLAVHLEIQLEPHPLFALTTWDSDGATQRSVIEYHCANNGDPKASARRAITRAAAAIGEAMK